MGNWTDFTPLQLKKIGRYILYITGFWGPIF